MTTPALNTTLGGAGLTDELLRRAGVTVQGDQSPRPSGRVSLVPSEIETALRRGWRLHPLRPKDKLPVLKEWQHRATSDPRQVEAWAGEHRGCNWGAVCGPESGFFAVDVDDHGAVPEGLCNVTSRGYQLLYTWPKGVDVRPATGCPCDGIDVRGRDSYIVIPPSVHPSGHVYHYSDDSLPLPACPPWMLGLIATRAQAGAQTRQSAPAAGAVGDTGIIPRGKGDPEKLKLAGSMFRSHQPFDVILAAVVALDRKCEHQHGEAECRRKVEEWTKRYARGEALADKESAIIRPDLVRLSTVEARDVNWLWNPFLPLGMLSMISGDPGSGKSYIAQNIAAEGSRGRLRDGRIVEPFSTLYLTVENPEHEVMRPRFDLLGGDPSKFYLLKGTSVTVEEEQTKGSVTLADVHILGMAIKETGARLVVIDPLQSFLGSGVDLHRSNETRPVLDGLGKLAEEHGCSILILRHLAKTGGGKAIHRGLGSIDLTGAVRSEMLAGGLPDDPESRALCHIKSNVGAMGRALGYAIDGVGRFSWTGESTITAFDLLAAPEGPDRKLTEATQWLSDKLRAGSLEAREIRDAAEAAGISWRTLQRAKTALRICSRKATFGGGWLWWLPTTEPGSEARE